MQQVSTRSTAVALAFFALIGVSTGALAQSDAGSKSVADDLVTIQERIEATSAEIERLKKLIEGAEGGFRAILERRLESRQVQIVDDVNKLGSMILANKESGEDVSQMQRIQTGYLQRLLPGLRKQIDRLNGDLIALQSAAPAENMRDAMSRVLETNTATSTLVDWYAAYQRSTQSLNSFGIDAAEHQEFLSEQLLKLAEFLADAIDLASKEIDETRFFLKVTPENEDLQTQLKLLELRRDNLVTNLTAISNLLDDLDIDSSRYKSLALQISGDVSKGLLETGVWTKLLQDWGQNAWTWISENSLTWTLRLIILVIILMIARALSRITRRVVEQAISKVNLSHLLRRMIVATAANGVFVIGALVALSQLGISVGPVLAGLGIAGIIIGFALQDTLSNFASGMMILIYRPYDVGDFINAGGEVGTVTDMSLISTVIMTIDNQKLVVPNNLIWGGVIRNVTAESTRRVDMTFGISYSDDIPKTERVLAEILRSHDLVLDEPEPMVKLHTLGESSVDFVVRPWVRTEDYWKVYWDVTRAVKLRFDEEGISIPFPQRDVHIHGANTQEEAAATT